MGQAKTGAVERARRRGRAGTAARLGVQPRAVRERDVGPGEVGGLLAARPGWLIAEERRQAQIRRAKQEARQLASELTAEQVRAGNGRERDASYAAARYRASQLLRRALRG